MVRLCALRNILKHKKQDSCNKQWGRKFSAVICPKMVRVYGFSLGH